MATESKPFKDEREAWDVTWGPDGGKVRSEFTRWFRDIFPNGHRDSIRRLVASMCDEKTRQTFCAHEKGRWLKDMHPEAFAFLEQYGIDYRPFAFRTYPDFGIGEPISRQCFRNSFLLMCKMNLKLLDNDPLARTYMQARGPMVYVEGMTAGALCAPMLHAWNALGNSRIAIDWTHSSSARWDRYIGFPVTFEEHNEAMRILSPDKSVRYPLFDKYTFGKLKDYLYTLARSREEKTMTRVA